MALGALCWASRLVGFLGLLMAYLAILMIGILCRNGFPLGLGLMADLTPLYGLTWLLTFHLVVAFHAFDL